MAGVLVDEKDIRFALFDVLGIQDLFEHKRFCGWNEKALQLAISEARRFAEKYLFPLHIEGDRIGVQFKEGRVLSVPGTKEAYQDFVKGGWLTLCEDEKLGGQELPKIVKYASHEIFLAANFPFMCYANLSHDAGKLIELFGTAYQRKTYLKNLYNGRWTGTMAITETVAGSDVGAIMTRATEISAGVYSIAGQKMFITNGEHDLTENIIHMVLARIDGDPPGSKGLSLFIVPKYRVNADGKLGELNDVQCIGIEKKMGLHGSPTTTMVFGEKSDCRGYLVGKAREGIKIMFHMINSSRLEVGIWGLGAASAAYRHAVSYAMARTQGADLCGAKPENKARIIQHPDIRRNLLAMKSHVDGMRLLLYYCGYAMDCAENAKTTEQNLRWRNIVELLTPLCKAYPTEKAVELVSMAVQVHGGYGYTKDFPVEQFMREIKAGCIFEGTTGIQAMDFVLRKAALGNGEVFEGLLKDLYYRVKPAENIPSLKPYTVQLKKTAAALAQLPHHLSENHAKQGIFYPLLKATLFLEAVGDLLLGYFLLWGAIVARKKLEELINGENIVSGEGNQVLLKTNLQAAYLSGKIDGAKYFIGNILPITDGKISAIKWGDISAWEMNERSF
jgi:alkylation response protein AidB-like acyl-CoA dehydrogenase